MAETTKKKSLPKGYHLFKNCDVSTTGDLINEFAQQLIGAKFQLVDGLTETGKVPARCDIKDSKIGAKLGWYYFRRVDDIAYGIYGDWREDTHIEWAGFLNKAPTAKQIKETKKAIADQVKGIGREREQLSIAAVKYVQSKLSVLPCLIKHKYLSEKKITAIINQTEIYKIGDEYGEVDIVLPITNFSGETINWQRIKNNGERSFKKHASIDNGFYVIGDLQSSTSVVYCVDFETGASIHLSISCSVVVCFSEDNLLPVMDVTRKIIKGRPVYIGVYNDTNGVGIEKAEECRKKYPDVSIAIPPFVDYTFSDMWCYHNGFGEASMLIVERFVMAGYVVPEKEQIRIWTGDDVVSNTPKILKTVPCPKVQKIAEWMETTAPKSSRQIALVGAIILACGIAGRSYRENEMNNFSSILACVIAPSGGGKDFVKKCVNDILQESKKKTMTDILGSASYTSEAAIRNQLIQNPVKISIMDEFGDKLSRGIGGGGATRDSEAFQAMKEIYSDSRGIWAGRAYAATDGNKITKDIRSQPVKNPSLTLLGISTPAQFIGAITDTHIEGGFLNRFIIIDARNDKITKRRKLEGEIPDWIVPHCETVIDKGAAPRDFGLDMGHKNIYSVKADPKMIHVSNEVSDLFSDFDDHLTEEYIEDDFMTNLSIRWHENARRLAVGLAAFENPHNPQITLALAQWCISFTQYHGKRLAALVDRYSCFDDGHRNRMACLEAIRKKKKLGMSRKEMNTATPFRGMTIAKRNNHLAELESQGHIGINILGLEKRGEIRYYATKSP